MLFSKSSELLAVVDTAEINLPTVGVHARLKAEHRSIGLRLPGKREKTTFKTLLDYQSRALASLKN